VLPEEGLEIGDIDPIIAHAAGQLGELCGQELLVLAGDALERVAGEIFVDEVVVEEGDAVVLLDLASGGRVGTVSGVVIRVLDD
jgi:hypothetical protein